MKKQTSHCTTAPPDEKPSVGLHQGKRMSARIKPNCHLCEHGEAIQNEATNEDRCGLLRRSTQTKM